MNGISSKIEINGFSDLTSLVPCVPNGWHAASLQEVVS